MLIDHKILLCPLVSQTLVAVLGYWTSYRGRLVVHQTKLAWRIVKRAQYQVGWYWHLDMSYRYAAKPPLCIYFTRTFALAIALYRQWFISKVIRIYFCVLGNMNHLSLLYVNTEQQASDSSRCCIVPLRHIFLWECVETRFAMIDVLKNGESWWEMWSWRARNWSISSAIVVFFILPDGTILW